MSRKTFKCPFCKAEYISKPSLYSHMESNHPEQVTNIPASQVYFNYKNRYELGRTNGRCIIDGKPTEWNEKTERYERICSEDCRQIYREQFKRRMKQRYGREHLLNDPDQQKKMLAGRKISGTYTWSDGSKEFTYTGSYEKDFLEFLDNILGFTNSSDIHSPAPQIFRYKVDGKESFYIPDFYIESLNLIVEIKSKTNNHYRQRDIHIEKTKDDILGNSGYNYIKIFDKDYRGFTKLLDKFKEN
jgi:hypothetical protein